MNQLCQPKGFVEPIPADERLAKMEATNRRVSEKQREVRERAANLAYINEINAIEMEYHYG